MSILFKFFSHLLFIVMAHHLLIGLVDWEKFLKGTAENQQKIQLLMLFLAIGLGYLVSTFFLDVMSIGRSFSEVFIQ